MAQDQGTHAPFDPNLFRDCRGVLTESVDVAVPNVQLTKRVVRRVERRDTLDVLGVTDPARQNRQATRRRLEDTERSTFQLRTAYECVDALVQIVSVAAENVHGFESSASTNVCKHIHALDVHVLILFVLIGCALHLADDSDSPNGTCDLVRPREDVRVCAERRVRRLDVVVFHLSTRLTRNPSVPRQRTVTLERLLEVIHTFKPRTMGDDDEPATHLVSHFDTVQLFQRVQARV